MQWFKEEKSMYSFNQTFQFRVAVLLFLFVFNRGWGNDNTTKMYIFYLLTSFFREKIIIVNNWRILTLNLILWMSRLLHVI